MRASVWTTVLTAAATLALFFPTSSQALASHVSCGDTITQDTKLDSDLVNCPADGIIIGADNIRLDLNGHTIDGDGQESGSDTLGDSGVENRLGYDRVGIVGGQIQEFSTAVTLTQQFQLGVPLEGANDNVVRGISAVRDPTGVFLSISEGSLVEEDSFSRIDEAIHLSNANHILVRHNSIDLSPRAGVSLSNSSRNRISDNTVSHSNVAVALQASSDNRVERNLLRNNTQAISLDPDFAGFNNCPASPSERNLIAHNTLTDNPFDGVQIFCDASANDVQQNDITGGFRGVFILKASGNFVEQNTIRRSIFGISELNAGGNELSKNSISDAVANGIDLFGSQGGGVIALNRILRSGVDGVLIDAGSAGWLVDHNFTDENGDDGIDVEAPQTTISANAANRNHDLGIEAVPGTIDGGGNKASGNGNPAQCTNVACK